MDRASRWLRSLWRVLGSTWLAAILLAVLLLATLFASLLPQMPASPTALEPWLSAVALRYGRATGLLHTLGLFQVYRSPWFLALLAILLLNTLICTVQRLPRLWRSITEPPVVARPEAFYQGFAHRTECPVTSLGDGLLATQSILARYHYRTYVEREETAVHAHLYAERHRWAQVSTAVSHLATLFLVMAVIARPVLGWQETGVILSPGQTYTVGHGRGWLVGAGQGEVSLHPDGQPRNYRVPLVVQVSDSPPVTRTVSINHPLTYRGVALHLQSYGPAAHLTTPQGEFGLAFTTSQAQEVVLSPTGPTLRVAYRPEDEVLFVEAFAADGAMMGSGLVPDGQQIEVGDTPVTFTLSHYTSWQVSHDPTFGLALGAALMLLAAMLLSLWAPHRRLWLRLDSHCVQMVGAGDFDGEFELLAGELALACQAEQASPPTQKGETFLAMSDEEISAADQTRTGEANG